MRFSSISSLLGLASLVSARSGVFTGSSDRKFTTRSPEGIELTVFEHRATGSSLEYVTNSGVCETTPGVNQYSGYLNVGKNMSMWFWFFEARHNPKTAPVSIWLNGGPGCSSMIGLFQENGPCHFVDNATEPTLNPHSWNEYANMLYIDQPIGTGFSTGTIDVNSTVQAAPYVWKFMQAFFANFPKYKSREFGLFTESYGGHYGPKFANYFLEQNKKIEEGCEKGTKIDMIALGINNGWIDPKPQFKAYATYAYNNPYKKILDDTNIKRFLDVYKDMCAPALDNCTSLVGDDEACANADDVCNTQLFTNLQIASGVDFNVYDVRIGANDVDPPESYLDYITRKDIAKRIGARSTFAECSDPVYNDFVVTGDDARSTLSLLSDVVKQNIATLIWAGDTDWICNWEGNYVVVNKIDWHGRKKFAKQKVKPYTVGGKLHGEYKTLGNLSWLKVYEAGHEVPYYQPEVALQAFKQIMQGKPLKAT
ncbi:Fc.00g005540.m01.CDS01 [Cosmosporella sp. VM-42]